MKWPKLRFAKTSEEIVKVYLAGPSSCMTQPAKRYATAGIHPMSALGADDIHVAYIQDPDTGEVLSRSLVIARNRVRHEMYFTYLYDRWCMLDRLLDLGYIFGPGPELWKGLKVKRIPLGSKQDEGFVAPGIDPCQGPGGTLYWDNGKHLVLGEAPEGKTQLIADHFLGVAMPVGHRVLVAAEKARAEAEAAAKKKQPDISDDDARHWAGMY